MTPSQPLRGTRLHDIASKDLHAITSEARSCNPDQLLPVPKLLLFKDPQSSARTTLTGVVRLNLPESSQGLKSHGTQQLHVNPALGTGPFGAYRGCHGWEASRLLELQTFMEAGSHIGFLKVHWGSCCGASLQPCL